jgi:hypothetical protein
MALRGWRNTAAALKLRDQINTRWPNRDKRSDGTIGDTAHAARKSDHNPDAGGWVKALDIDADLDPKDGRAAEKLATDLINYARSGKPGSERIKYVVFNNRIASGTYRDQFWTWRPGAWGHQHHIHVSFTDAAEFDALPFPLPSLVTLLPVVSFRQMSDGKHPDQTRLVQAALKRHVDARLVVDGVWKRADSRAWARAVVKFRRSRVSLLSYLGAGNGFRATR